MLSSKTKDKSKMRKSSVGPGGTSTRKKKSTATAAKKSPYDAYMERTRKFMSKHGFTDCILVVQGVEGDDDGNDDDDETIDISQYSQEQIRRRLRYILMTKKREDQLAAMRELILGKQAKHDIQGFYTSFSYRVSDSLDVFRKKLSRTKNPDDKFDLLLAYTLTVWEFDVWMHDNEQDMGVFTKGLARIWKLLLAKSDVELRWDMEYTKPAVLEMLHQFKEEVACFGRMEFNYI